MKIYIDDINKVIKDEESLYIKKAILAVVNIENIKGEGEISVSIVNDEEIKILNYDYRGINKSTDVLSFPQYKNINEILKEDYKVIGDIVINIDQVKKQALKFSNSIMREIAYLSIHSMYHLLGFNHENESERKFMREKEEMAYRMFLEDIK